MRVSQSLKSVPAAPASERARDSITSDGLRLLDWTDLNTVPESPDLASIALATPGARPRLAILVNSPKMLRAADVFAEQAVLHGAQARVFVDSTEALTWLGKQRH